MASMTHMKPAQARQRETTRESTSDQQLERQRRPATAAPPVDIYETDTGYVLMADMPGVTPDGLEVIAERDELTIRGRVTRQNETPPIYQEFELTDYYRVFMLTQDLETDQVSATLRDGVLRVEIPKSARLQPKKIPVKTE